MMRFESVIFMKGFVELKVHRTNGISNRLIREKLPKKASIDHISLDKIEEIMNELNSRPMKVLDFLTPKECLLARRLLKGLGLVVGEFSSLILGGFNECLL